MSSRSRERAECFEEIFNINSNDMSAPVFQVHINFEMANGTKPASTLEEKWWGTATKSLVEASEEFIAISHQRRCQMDYTILFAAEIALCGLDRRVPEQELNLLQLTAAIVTQEDCVGTATPTPTIAAIAASNKAKLRTEEFLEG